MVWHVAAKISFLFQGYHQLANTAILILPVSQQVQHRHPYRNTVFHLV
jgi:hypothetical protein